MLKSIKTEKQYSDTLARVYELMQTDIKDNPSATDELEVLSILVKEYELQHYPIPQI